MDAGNVIAAFSEEQVRRLTGLTQRQLRYWDTTGVLSPSFADEERSNLADGVYSFLDVAALKTLSALRQKVSLQHLREAGNHMKAMNMAAWTGTLLYVHKRKVIFQEPGSGKPREVVSGQYVFPMVLEVVVSDTREAVARLRLRPAGKIGQIERHRNVSSNAWVIGGTRVHVASIRRLAEDGYTTAQIIAEYPSLKERDVEAALAHHGAPVAA